MKPIPVVSTRAVKPNHAFDSDGPEGASLVPSGFPPTLGVAGRWSMRTLDRETRPMKFDAKAVSTSVAGDYYQVMFEHECDSDSPEIPYLLIQRQFEMPDAGKCYIETHDENYIGHFRLRHLDFSASRILVEIDRRKTITLK